MAHYWIAMFMIIITNSQASASDQGSPCQFCYLKQPPDAVEDCNPYTASTIKIQCQVEGPVGAALKIKWFFESVDDSGTTTEIGDSTPPHNAQIIKIETTSGTKRLVVSTLRITQLMVGDYWCQVFHEDTGLLGSQKIGIAGEDDFGRLNDCANDEEFSETIKKCADIPIPEFTNIGGTRSSSTTCPLTETRPSQSTTTLTTDTPLIMATSTVPPSQSYTSPATMIMQQSSIISASPGTQSRDLVPNETMPGSRPSVPIASYSPSSDSTTLNDAKQAQTWLFVVVGLSGMFLILIIVLIIVFALLCLTGPTAVRKRPNKLNLRNRLDTITSPVTTDPPSRPLTSMTLQTDIAIAACQEAKLIPGYNPLDQDYEDIDDEEDVDRNMMSNPRYHEQGPTIVGSAVSPGSINQPLYTIPTDVEYSEIGTGQDGHGTSSPSHGYGKLDHSARPRQTYNPRINSPLLSGYRKLEHVRASSTSTGTTTLPNQSMRSPGYANISVSNNNGGGGGANGGPHHFRSISLPGSEYSNLNHNSNNNQTVTTPTTPLPSTPAAATPTSKKYTNFAIIEACDGARSGENEILHSSVSRLGSEDYQMLSDATTIDRSDPPNMKEEYEFLPICVCEDEEAVPPPQSPSSSHFGSHGEALMRRHIESALGRELVEEQMSVHSHCSSDFTGPFFFPHMADVDGRPMTDDNNRHVYRALELSTMEPKKGYTSVNIKDESQ